jgi:hypothetical protein
MLGRNSYTQQELDHGRSAIDQQLAAHRKLVKAIASETDPTLQSALEDFDGQFFNNLTLALDRYFVHRIRAVAGKDGNPLNEVELLVESLMSNDGIFEGNKVIKYVPEQAVLKLNVGDRIRLSADDFERLAAAFFAELESRFL